MYNRTIERKEVKKMKKILSVLMASAMLSISAVPTVFADDSNCKIKDILSNLSQYTCSADIVSKKNDCKIFDILGGISGLCDKLGLGGSCDSDGSCDTDGSYGSSESTDIADRILDILRDKFATGGGQNDKDEVKLPDHAVDETPEAEPDTENVQKPSVDMAQQVIDLVNSYRAQYGLSPVAYDADAACAAQKRAVEIQSVFSHTRPDGSRCFTALDECGASYRGAGENIAMGQQGAQEVMNDWMNSEGHRANILNSSFKNIGVGVAKGADGRYYWTQMFTY